MAVASVLYLIASAVHVSRWIVGHDRIFYRMQDEVSTHELFFVELMNDYGPPLFAITAACGIAFIIMQYKFLHRLWDRTDHIDTKSAELPPNNTK